MTSFYSLFGVKNNDFVLSFLIILSNNIYILSQKLENRPSSSSSSSSFFLLLLLHLGLSLLDPRPSCGDPSIEVECSWNLRWRSFLMVLMVSFSEMMLFSRVLQVSAGSSLLRPVGSFSSILQNSCEYISFKTRSNDDTIDPSSSYCCCYY